MTSSLVNRMMVTSRPVRISAASVIGESGRFEVLTSIELDRQPLLGAEEVEDEVIDRMLSPELEVRKAPAPEMEPQKGFRRGRLTAQAPTAHQ
jgi:hypothetical protein